MFRSDSRITDYLLTIPHGALRRILHRTTTRKWGGAGTGLPRKPQWWTTAKGPFKNNFRFWRERRRARCEARGGGIPHSGAVTDEQGSRWPDAAPPLRAGALWLSGFVSPSSQTASGILVARASPPKQITSRQIGIL